MKRKRNWAFLAFVTATIAILVTGFYLGITHQEARRADNGPTGAGPWFDLLADWSAFAAPLPRHDAAAYCYEELSFAGMRYIHDPAPIALDASVSSPELPSSPRELKPATSRANHFPPDTKPAQCGLFVATETSPQLGDGSVRSSVSPDTAVSFYLSVMHQ